MLVSRKDRYALQALFELAKRHGRGPVKVADIAKAQSIPPRFLEVILNELKQAGFVASRRGKQGGYLLLPSPEELTIGHVMRFLHGPEHLAGGAATPGDDGHEVLRSVWQKAQEAILHVYDNTAFSDLVEQERQAKMRHVPSYAI